MKKGKKDISDLQHLGNLKHKKSEYRRRVRKEHVSSNHLMDLLWHSSTESCFPRMNNCGSETRAKLLMCLLKELISTQMSIYLDPYRSGPSKLLLLKKIISNSSTNIEFNAVY